MPSKNYNLINKSTGLIVIILSFNESFNPHATEEIWFCS